MTTGGGVVRFNPNLYQNGKVCLSILGWVNESDVLKSSMHVYIQLTRLNYVNTQRSLYSSSIASNTLNSCYGRRGIIPPTPCGVHCTLHLHCLILLVICSGILYNCVLVVWHYQAPSPSNEGWGHLDQHRLHRMCQSPLLRRCGPLEEFWYTVESPIMDADIHIDLIRGQPLCSVVLIQYACFISQFMYTLDSTWKGPAWSAVQSLQSILMSIQTLLNERPYHNEPGFHQVSGCGFFTSILYKYSVLPTQEGGREGGKGGGGGREGRCITKLYYHSLLP